MLALSSIFLASSFSGCNTTHSGYQVITGKAKWVTAENAIQEKHTRTKTLLGAEGRFTYTAGLVLAVITLGMVIGKASPLQNPRVLRVMSGVSAMLAVFAVTDLCFAISYLLVPRLQTAMFAMQAVHWTAPFVLWRVFGLSAVSRRRQLWPQMSLALAVLFLPLVFTFVNLGFWVTVGLELPGYAAYIFGIHLMWWGYWRAGEELRLSKPSDESPRSFAAGAG